MAVEGKTENPLKWHTASRKIGKRNGLSSLPHRLSLHASPVEASLLSPSDLDPYAARISWLRPDGKREILRRWEVRPRWRKRPGICVSSSESQSGESVACSRPTFLGLWGSLKLWVILPKSARRGIGRQSGDTKKWRRTSRRDISITFLCCFEKSSPIGDRDNTISLDSGTA